MTMKVISGGNQMSLIRDTEEVVKFLEFAERKSILSEQAVNCRLTACHNLFSVLNEEEDGIDYILQNLDVLIHRFRNKNNNVRASTLKVYKSRVKSSLEDFKAWSADPFAWERALSDKAKALGLERKERKPKSKKPKILHTSNQKRRATPHSVDREVETPTPQNSSTERSVSFPIRSDFSVEMTLPPGGITLKELQRLGMFLYPYCIDIDQDRSPWSPLAQLGQSLQ